MHIHAPAKLEAVYVHRVQPLNETHGYDPDRWRANGLQDKICFFEVRVCYMCDFISFLAKLTTAFVRSFARSWEINRILSRPDCTLRGRRGSDWRVFGASATTP